MSARPELGRWDGQLKVKARVEKRKVTMTKKFVPAETTGRIKTRLLDISVQRRTNFIIRTKAEGLLFKRTTLCSKLKLWWKAKL